jgi:cytochrome c biogenesis protein
MEVHDALPRAVCADLARALAARGYQVFATPTGQLYGFKGLIGKMAPLAVHAGLLLSMVGFLTSALGGATGSAMAPEGSAFVMADALRPASALTLLPRAASLRLRVDDFRISYYASGVVSQFYSDLSVLAPDGRVLASQEMKVNVPLRYGGVTAYQTDWAIAAATVRVGDAGGAAGLEGDAGAAAARAAPPLALPMASLEGAAGFSGRIWGTFVPLPGGPPPVPGERPRGATMVARDLQSAAFYDRSGAFVGVRRPGSGKPILVDGVPLLLEALTGATGLELKSDPGVPIVYAGFGGVMLTSFLSFVSHSQVWALQQGTTLHVGGRTTKQKARARVRNGGARCMARCRVCACADACFLSCRPPATQRAFAEELEDALATLPEYVDAEEEGLPPPR